MGMLLTESNFDIAKQPVSEWMTLHPFYFMVVGGRLIAVGQCPAGLCYSQASGTSHVAVRESLP